MEYTLVIDQGTHASRAILFDEAGQAIEQHSQNIDLRRIDHERVEQDAEDILQSVLDVIQRLDKQRLEKTARCAIATQRSTLVAWHRQTGQALYPAISWQDRRGHRQTEQLADHQQTIHNISGLPLSPHYGASKMHWLLQHVSAVKQAQQAQQCCIAPLASFLLHRLVADRPCLSDYSNAHRSQLFDIRKLKWSDKLMQLFGVPGDLLADCRPVISDYGELGINNIPVTAMCGDQTAALYAGGTMTTDSALINMGTGAFILRPMTSAITDTALLCSMGKSDPYHVDYLLEGTVNGAGAALDRAQQDLPVDHLHEQLAHWLQQDYAHIPLFINAVGGLGSPWWNSQATPHFMHDENSSRAEKTVAIVESIAFLLWDNIQVMKNISALNTLYVSGGLSRLDGLCQLLASLSQLPVHRFEHSEATASGAAWLALNCPDNWPRAQIDRVFQPEHRPALEQRYREFNSYISSL